MAQVNLGHVRGEDGQGVPTGGTTGQYLIKSSGTDFDTEWSSLGQVTQLADGLMTAQDKTKLDGMANTENAVAIVVNGNTAPKNLASGDYLFIKNHGTLANGGYHAKTAISAGDTISGSNVAADADGMANALKSFIDTVGGNLTTLGGVVDDLSNASIKFKSYSIPTDGKSLTLKGGTRGFIYIPCANAAGQFGLYMFNGGSTASYIREILQSSFVGVTASGNGNFVFTNSSSSSKTVYFIAIGSFGNLPDE